MKKLTLIAAFVLLAISVQAQQYVVTTLRTTNVAGLATATLTDEITLTKYQDCCIAFTAQGMTGATGIVTAAFVRGVDGSNWQSLGGFDLKVTLNGATAVTMVTNVIVGSTGYLKLKSIASADEDAAIIATNTIKVAKKPQRFGR